MGLADVYLVFYNLAQAIGWLVVFLSTIGGLYNTVRHGAPLYAVFWDGARPAGTNGAAASSNHAQLHLASS